jgi:PGF-pre-PGF domain-containing protein
MKLKRGMLLIWIVLTLILLVLFVYAVTQTYMNENTQWEQNMTGAQHSALVFGDLDNNDYDDMILIGQSTSNYIAKVYTNNGSVLVENSTWQQNLTAVAYGSISLGDLDNDGDLDLALVGCASGGGLDSCNSLKSIIYTNNGTSLVENITWGNNITGVSVGALSFTDFNNDGQLDLIIIGQNEITRLAKVYINNGTSLVSNTQWGTNLLGLQDNSLVLGDINNDGFIDLLSMGTTGTKYTKIYINNGTSLNEDSIWENGLTGLNQGGAIFGDYDNDGDLDLSYMGCCDHHYIYHNNGTTFVLNKTDIFGGGGLIGTFEGSISFGDYDNDGYLDLITSGREGYTTLYINNLGTFSNNGDDPETHIPNIYFTTLAWNDLDNDYDLDIILSGWDGSSTIYAKSYINNRSLTSNNSVPYLPATFTNNSLGNGNVFFGWGNASDNETPSLGLYYNLRIGTTSGGNEIVSGMFGGTAGGGWDGGGANGYFGNMMQRRNISLLGSRFQVGTTYYWSVQTIDTGLAKSSWSPELTFTLTSDFTPPTITLNAPENNDLTNSSSVTFNATVYDDTNLSNVSLYGNWSNWHANETNSSGINNTNYIFVKNLSDGNYLWGIRACDNYSNCWNSANRTFRVDQTLPSMELLSPTNASSWTSSSTISFVYNVTDISVNNCSLLIDGSVNTRDTSITINTNQTFSASVSNGVHNWSIRCTDVANNINTSYEYKLSVSYTAPTTPTSSSGGGGSGGGGSSDSIYQRWLNLNGNQQVTMKVIAKNNPVTQVLFKTTKALTSASLEVKDLSEKPATLKTVSKKVYKYLNFTSENMVDIESIDIRFNVSQTWIKENNFKKNNIALFRFVDGEWVKLVTNKLTSSSDSVSYRAITSGFSYFAVAAQDGEIIIKETKKNETIEEEILEEIIQEKNEVSEDIPQIKNRLKIILPTGILLIITAVISALIIIKKKKITGRK